jgi:hypothetical protein
MVSRMSLGGLVLLVLLTPLAGIVLGNSQVAVAPPVTTIGERAGRSQASIVGSDSYLAWEDRATPSGPAPENPADDPTRGSSDILGLDLVRNRPIAVTVSPGDQYEPAIAGSLVVWQDTGHSCPTCEADIRGKDLAIGAEFAVATGPADQISPAINGRTVVWREADSERIRLLSRHLDSQVATELAAVARPGTISKPVMSADLVVWAEQVGANPAALRAYDRATGQVSKVADSGLNYAVSGRRVVWTDPALWLTDLGTGTTALLDSGRTSSPAIDGDTVVWNGLEAGPGPDLIGMDLATKRHLLLVGGTERKRGARLIGDRLVWLSDEAGSSRVLSTPRAQAFALAMPRPPRSALLPAAMTDADAAVEEPVLEALGHSTSFTRPTHKGMHAANDWGWATYMANDALGAPNQPFFGSIVVLQSDLGKGTGRGAPWGPTVADSLRHMQITWNTRIIVRLFPTSRPDQHTPDHVGQKVISLVNAYDWVKHIQVDNEPNQVGDEWPPFCNPCQWDGRTYVYQDRLDRRLYWQIRDFYTQAWYVIRYYRDNHPNPTIRARINELERWTPPMTDIYQVTINREAEPDQNDLNMYEHLRSMIDLYATQDNRGGVKRGGFTYHTYPAPNWDIFTGSDRIYNNSWVWGFDGYVQDRVYYIFDRNPNDPARWRSMITEFGWNPGQMISCSAPLGRTMTHNTDWPTDGVIRPHEQRGSSCYTMDGRTHRFYTDIDMFLATERARAEVVAVWIVRGYTDETGLQRADGITSGNPPVVLNWLHRYQWSRP